MSNVIKSVNVVPLEHLKKLEQQRISGVIPQNISNIAAESGGEQAADVELESLRNRILKDAEQAARLILQQAQEASEEKLAEAQRNAEEWWVGRRAEDEAFRSQMAEEGYREGYASAAEQAEAEVWNNWGTKLQEAEDVVLQAYAAKETIIAESEMFLVELSCSIAGKIMGAALAEAPETALKLYAQALSRRKEQGPIVLCVSPAHFAFVQAAKEELSMSLDSQADLQIVPDSSVREGGCVVRSSFGSIDARIDTQLEEIREALLAVAAHLSEEGESDGFS